MTTEKFFEVPRTPHATSEGIVELPILYYDASNVVAIFAVRPAAAEALLEGTRLEPVVVAGRAVVALSFYEYRASSVGPYNEVGTAILAKRAGAPLRWKTSGAFVVDLPVTTRAANAAGRELWGYPKFVTKIGFRLDGRDVESSVEDPASHEPIVSLRGRMGRAIPAPPISFATFTMSRGDLLRTPIDVRGRCAFHAAGSVSLRVGSSEHPMAKHLRELGLDAARPRALVSTDRFASRLHEGAAA